MTDYQQKQTRESGCPLIAVIVPVYNGGDYLHECVDSILGQTFRNFELWLVDDGSTDGSGAVCDQTASADARAHVVHKQNEGLMATWMRGVRESRAPYLCFVDCDDWISRDMLEKMAAQLDGAPGNAGEAKAQETGHCAQTEEGQELREIICGNYVIEREGNPQTADRKKVRSEEKYNAAAPGIYTGEKLEKEIRQKLLGNEERTLIFSRCMKLISRALIEENMHYCDPAVRMGEDVNIMVPAILDAERVVVMDRTDCDYHYRFVDSSMVHKYDPGMYDNMIRLRKILYHVMEDKNVPAGRVMADREFLFLLFFVMKNEIRRAGVPVQTIVDRIREICRKEDTPCMIRDYPGKITVPVNRILVFMMRKPTSFRIRMARLLFNIRG